MMRRPAAPLLSLLAFALLSVGGLLLLLQVQAAASCCCGLPTTRTRQPPPPHHPTEEQQGRRRRLGGGDRAEENKVRLGSRPPSCRGKCYECSPCRAVQVPTLTLSNYKPMGWKCQCRDRLYQP